MKPWSFSSKVKYPLRLGSLTYHCRLLYSTVIAVPVLLSGCQLHASVDELSLTKTHLLVERKIVDFGTIPCENIWSNEDTEPLANPLFWLRAMDCSSSLNRVVARKQAKEQNLNSWHGTLKQGILIADTQLSTLQRQQLLNRINDYRLDIPVSLRPLLQLWREQQVNQLALQEERKRYKQLVASTDSKIDTLKAKESHLQYQLAETSRKLASLTDIEHQLSSRKQLQNEVPSVQEDKTRPKQGEERKDIPPAKTSEPSVVEQEQTVTESGSVVKKTEQSKLLAVPPENKP